MIHKTQNKPVEEQNFITLTHVTHVYNEGKPNATTALNDISLTINRGEMVAITGPSGCGKSTLLQLIGGLDRPTTGNVVVSGMQVERLRGSKLARYRGETIGFVFQSFYLQPFLSVAKNVEIPLMFARTKRSTRPPIVERSITAVGLDQRSQYFPGQLSGGQLQRAAIARAIINEPSVILADEPTGNLDSQNSTAIINLLKSIRDTNTTTIVIVTHDEGIAAVADRCIRLEDGRVL